MRNSTVTNQNSNNDHKHKDHRGNNKMKNSTDNNYYQRNPLFCSRFVQVQNFLTVILISMHCKILNFKNLRTPSFFVWFFFPLFPWDTDVPKYRFKSPAEACKVHPRNKRQSDGPVRTCIQLQDHAPWFGYTSFKSGSNRY